MDLVLRTIGIVLANVYAFAACWVWLRLFGPKARNLRRMAVASERGQGLVEYALILVLVAVVVIGVLMVLGPSIKGLF
jgi:pilus assembly protein Flp/PilA